MIVLFGFVLGLHASIPAANNVSRFDRPSDLQFEGLSSSNPSRLGPVLTATPADVSFYEQFYPSHVNHELRPRTDVLHKLASLIKKAVRR